jgi:hypothetical protein
VPCGPRKKIRDINDLLVGAMDDDDEDAETPETARKNVEKIDGPMNTVTGNDNDSGAGRHVYSNPIDPYRTCARSCPLLTSCTP